MDIKVIGRKVTVTDALNDYAIEKIGNAMKVMSLDVADTEVVLRVEKTRAIPCICEVTIRLKGHTIHVEEHEEDMRPPRFFVSCASTRPALSITACAKP